MVGDSLMLGSAYEPPLVPGWGPSLARLLANRGWGPVRMAAGVGFQAGKKVINNPGADMSFWLTTQRGQGFDPQVIAVSLGPNDIIACVGNVDCAADDIRGFMDTAGPDHEVWWALQTTENPDFQTAWNQALQIVAAERPNLTLWDWPSVLVAEGIPLSADNTHLPGAPQYLQRSTLMADDVTSKLGGSRQVGPEVTPPAGGPSYQYQPLPPQRVTDTRDTGSRIAAGGTLTVDLSTYTPTAAVAAVVNVAAANPSVAGYVTVWPCGADRPVASSVNFLAGQNRGAQATTLLRQPDRSLCVFSNAATDIIVDLQGAFVPTGALRLAGFNPPQRLLDTRPFGRQPTLTIQAPLNAKAVSATLTVTGGTAAGFLTAYPCSDTPPVVSNVNWQPGETVAGAVFVPTAADSTFCIFTSTPTDVIVDLTGVFNDPGPTSTMQFVPVAPTRMVDTRLGIGGWRGHPGIGQSIEVGVAANEALAVTGTITIVSPGTDGYLAGTTCGQPVGATSSVNGATSSVMANSLTVALSPGGNMCISSSVAAHALFDTTGWWVVGDPV